MKQIRSMIRIPLDSMTEPDQAKIKEMDGRIIVVDSSELCLTCGRHKRMKYTQRIDGKLFVLEECLYCTINNGNGKFHGTLTFANRQTK